MFSSSGEGPPGPAGSGAGDGSPPPPPGPPGGGLSAPPSPAVASPLAPASSCSGWLRSGGLPRRGEGERNGSRYPCADVPPARICGAPRNPRLAATVSDLLVGDRDRNGPCPSRDCALTDARGARAERGDSVFLADDDPWISSSMP